MTWRSGDLLIAALLLESVAAAGIVEDVRTAISRKNFAQGASLIEQYRASRGATPEMLVALSWLGRGTLAARQLDEAESYAGQTHKLALEELKKRPLDADKQLPIALGAAIEVRAQVMAARGERSGAAEYLRRELAAYRNTSIRARIQKNIHLLSLEGKAAPSLEVARWLGPRPQPLSALRGKPVLLFFWAHWCGDCKGQAAILAQFKREFGGKGLVLVAPTQRYGYKQRGEDATPEEELKYIEEVRQRYYSDLADVPAPVSEENFKNYGASATPTLVLVDRNGIVRLYHPGVMSYAELKEKIEAVVEAPRAS